MPSSRAVERFVTLDDNRSNNFNFLRLLFAIFVVYSHSFVLVANKQRDYLDFTRGQTYLGEIAVDGFFIISGYLITMSWCRNERFWEFLKKRCLRIYPAFLVSCML